eukprot:gene8868-585_t
MLATQNITAAMLKDQNKTAAELLGLGFPPKVLVAAGFTATELSNAGVNEETIASLVTVTQNSANTTGHKDTAIGVGVGVFAALFAILVGVWYWKRKSTNRNEYANTPHARVNPAFIGASTANLYAVPDQNQPEVYDEEANISSNSISISIQQRSSLTGISAVYAIPVGLADEHVYVEDGFYHSAATGGGRNSSNSNSNATYANTGAGVQTGSIYNTLQSARSNGRSSNTNTANPRSPSFGTPPSLTLTSSGTPRGPGQDQGGTSA